MNRAKTVSSKLCGLLAFTIFAVLFSIPIPNAPVRAQQKSPTLQGVVKDQMEAVIVGAEVVLNSEDGIVQKTFTDEQGVFRLSLAAGGDFTLRVTAQGFSAYEEPLALDPNAKPRRLSITLYPSVKADMTVNLATDEGLFSPESAAGKQVLSEAAMESLPDDPEQLAERLQQLAASSGGAPGQATVTVDGFQTGGRLPAKSAIRTVRINPNLYSAEYSTPPFGGGRIEVTTKPGAESLSGSLFLNYNASALNARDPFAPARAQNQTRRYGFQLGAPIKSKRAGFFLDFERREIREAATINAIVLNENFQPSGFAAAAPNPKHLLIGSARADWQLNKNRTLLFRYDLNRNKLAGQGVGGTNLAERGFDYRQTEHSYRLSEVAVISPRVVNELRLGLTVNRVGQSAASDAPVINVAGAFVAGGADIRQLDLEEKRLEVADNLSIEAGKHSLKMGVQIFNRRTRELRVENQNGTFFFGGGQTNGDMISSLEQYRRAVLNLQGGSPTRFSVNLGAPAVSVNQWLIAGFIQDQWKLGHRILLSPGLRYEAQSAPNDVMSFAPRLSVAYSPDKKQRWVFRAHAGVFYTRISDALRLEVERVDGVKQRQIIIDSPSFPNPFSGGTEDAIQTLRIFDPELQPPASLQMRVEFEHQLPHGWRVSASHSWTGGWSFLRSRNINAPLGGASGIDPRAAPRPFGIARNILQFESSGRFGGRVVTASLNQNSNRRFNLNLSYVNQNFQTDADSAFMLPQSSYDFTGEWSRPAWQARHRVFLSVVLNLPFNLRLANLLNAASGTPFNVTTGQDNNGDGNFNDRPGFTSWDDPHGIATPFGFLNPSVVNGDLRRNVGTNPGTAALEMSLSRTFAFGKKSVKGESRYKLTAQARVTNALNRTNLLGLNSVLTSPLFGRATQAAPARRIEFGFRFNF